ncbi:receptor-type guanylate cyclase gcy-28-like [Gryllus bimaculatus]|nr:receptor-type guanylate cyclase gcy-28-like [Gryllus bimaculatus]
MANTIVVVCANPKTVRDILLAAEELNMVDSGEYVFFNIELFNRMHGMGSSPTKLRRLEYQRHTSLF